MKRGDIYFIDIPYGTGNEIQRSRPGVIVSSDRINAAQSCVLVAFCTAKIKRLDYPSHVTIRSTQQLSTVLCDQLFTVDVSRLRHYIGHVTDEELSRIDIALSCAVGLDLAAPAPACDDEDERSAVEEPTCENPDAALEGDTESRRETATVRFLVGGKEIVVEVTA